MRSALALLLLPLVLGGCAHRVGKFLAPDAYVVPRTDADPASTVTYASGWKDEEPRPYDPEIFDEHWLRPVPITSDGWVEVRPPDGASIDVWTRRPGVGDRGFEPVLGRTGALRKKLPSELRLGWTVEDGALTLPIEHLANVYAGRPIEDGDLLLVRVDHGESEENYLFRVRRFGLRWRYGAGVLVRVPVPFVEGQQFGEVLPSTTLALSLTLGIRPRTKSPALYFLTEQFALVSSVGLGSTAVDELQGQSRVDSQLSGAFNAAIVGGGLEAFRFVSLQTQVNLSSFLREGPETPWALAVGFDAVQFAGFTRDAVTRLFWRNTLDAPEDR